jgi:hypothetical protein
MGKRGGKPVTIHYTFTLSGRSGPVGEADSRCIPVERFSDILEDDWCRQKTVLRESQWGVSEWTNAVHRLNVRRL